MSAPNTAIKDGLREILTRTVRIETRLCDLAERMGHDLSHESKCRVDLEKNTIHIEALDVSIGALINLAETVVGKPAYIMHKGEFIATIE